MIGKQFIFFLRFFCTLLLGTMLLACHTNKKTTATKKDTETSSSLDKDERKEKTKQLIKTAKSYLGTTYKAGETSKSGMDCSGLVFTSFQQVELKIPRTSKEQSKLGVEIKLANAQIGDLIFFATDGKSKGINHVGIVTAVLDNQDLVFIHSTIRAGVMENKLSEPYYQKAFEKIMRVY